MSEPITDEQIRELLALARQEGNDDLVSACSAALRGVTRLEQLRAQIRVTAAWNARHPR